MGQWPNYCAATALIAQFERPDRERLSAGKAKNVL